MAHVVPFAGIHYAPFLASLADVIAPPYDVLSPAQQDALYARHPANIVRLILNRDEDRYASAAAFLRESLASGVLIQDDTPAFYEYIQTFVHPLNPPQMLTRRTLLVALQLEPYANGVVLPHEETHPKAKADRLELMRATQANPEPIYGLYADPDLTVMKSLDVVRPDTPLLQITVDGDTHTLYRHTDDCLLSDLEDFFGPRRVWIADGHHRYETALNYQAEVGSGDGTKPSDYLLIGLSAFEDPGLLVLPTYRLIKNVSAARMEELPLLLERYFHVGIVTLETAREWIQQEVPGEERFVVVLPKKAYTLTLRDIGVMESAVEAPHCAAWRQLDVSILQTLVLDRTLGIGWKELAHTPDVAYTRDAAEAIRKVQNGEFQLACLLQNPHVTEVRDVAADGDKMPQKSTFFYPKLWSGLVLRSLK